MATVIVYRSKSASHACKRVVAAAPPGSIRAIQQDSYHHSPDDTAIVRWDCHDSLGIPAFAGDINPMDAVRQARDKIASRMLLGDLAPITWTSRAEVQLPAVLRPRRHKAGAHFHLCETAQAVVRAAKRHRLRGWYASPLIDKAREFRIFVLQGRVIAVSERFPADPADVAWNLALGGRLINVDRSAWPIPVLRAAISAMERLGLGFGAVDACLDTAGRVWVFEANTSPALRNTFTIKQIARALAAAGTVPAPVKARASKPRSFAHPALTRGDTR